MNVLSLAVTFFTGYILYKIKLTDDRTTQAIKSCKNYFVRNIKMKIENKSLEDHFVREFDTWLDKDLIYILISIWNSREEERSIEDPAILDYYRELKNCRKDKFWLHVLVFLNVLFLFSYTFNYIPSDISQWVAGFVLLVTIYVCLFKEPRTSIFNNLMINREKSEEARRIYQESKKLLEEERNKIKKDYKFNTPKT